MKDIDTVSSVNPFTPTFGTSPPLLVGRDTDLEDFREGLRDGLVRRVAGVIAETVIR